MRLNIRESLTGQKIVENFLRAAHYRESAEVKWEALEFEDGDGAKGVIAYPCQRKKRFWFFGPDRWVRDPDAVIFLYPLNLNDEHGDIMVDVRLTRPSQRAAVNDEVYDEFWKKYHYLHRQLDIILKNAFLIE
ncbi:MAG: hypothetical protein AAB568_01030 [Patescibacteria group bacterium]